MGFPVVWGEMTGDGDFPALLFGYGTPQYFDGIPFSYTDVHLTKWPGSYPPPSEKWGALVGTGDLFFPFFGSQNMIIADHKHVQAPADHEKKMVLIDVDGKDYFAFAGRAWGGGRGIFNFPQIKYFDGRGVRGRLQGRGAYLGRRVQAGRQDAGTGGRHPSHQRGDPGLHRPWRGAPAGALRSGLHLQLCQGRDPYHVRHRAAAGPGDQFLLRRGDAGRLPGRQICVHRPARADDPRYHRRFESHHWLPGSSSRRTRPIST